MNAIFSNRWRRSKIVALGVVLLLLCWHSFRVNSALTADYFTSITEGQTLTLTHLQIINITPEGMTIQIPDGRFPIVVAPPPGDAELGDIVNLTVVQQGGVLHVTACEVRKWRGLKVWVSVPVVLLVVVLFHRQYRFVGKHQGFMVRQDFDDA